MKIRSRLSTNLCVIAVCALQTGCAVFKPYVGQKAPFDAASIPQRISYEAAVSNANNLSKEIIDKQTELHQFDFWSGTVLIGAGLATAGLGVYGASSDAILGTALGAGAVVGARSYVPIKSRQEIYSTALMSIDTAVEKSKKIEKSGSADFDGIRPFGVRNNDGNENPEQIALKRAELKAAINNEIENPATSDARKIQLSQVSRVLVPAETVSGRKSNVAEIKANAFLNAVNAFNESDNRAALLMSELRTIINIANKALVNEVLDPSGALEKALAIVNKQRDDLKEKKAEAEKALDRAEDAQVLEEALVQSQLNVPKDEKISKLFNAVTTPSKSRLDSLRAAVLSVKID